MNAPLLDIRGVSKTFQLRRGIRDRDELVAVDDVTLAVPRGASFGIAGESGSGKSTLARMVLGLETPTTGVISFDGRDVAAMGRRSELAFRRHVQPVFQDATSSLNPRMRLSELITEPAIAQGHALGKQGLRERVGDLLEQVGLRRDMVRLFPHQLSGGQRQRVAIARALINDPSLLVLDEPVSALDVSIRSQVLNLLLDLKEARGLTYLIIAHDLAMLRHVTDHLAVMYLGRIVEVGETERIYADPRHPYTRELLEAVPSVDGPGLLRPLPVVAPDEQDGPPPTGCAFVPRCPLRVDRCRRERPELSPPHRPGHQAACFVTEPDPGGGAAAPPDGPPARIRSHHGR